MLTVALAALVACDFMLNIVILLYLARRPDRRRKSEGR